MVAVAPDIFSIARAAVHHATIQIDGVVDGFDRFLYRDARRLRSKISKQHSCPRRGETRPVRDKDSRTPINN